MAFLHLVALVALAVAQPILDLVARHPPFLVAHRATPADVALLLAALVAGVPGLLLLVETLAGLGGGRVRRAVHLAFVGALVGALALPLLHRLAGASDATALVAAAAVAGAGATAYARVAPFRSLLALASPAALVVPAFFLSRAEVREALAPAPPAAARASVARPAPVVFVVFDGLRLSDLLDAGGGIDAGRYPGFASLAAVSTWYRNTTTVAESTLLSVPAILTGRYPDAKRPPTLRANPGNLFTLLAGAYEIWSSEPITSLCPAALCREIREPHGPGGRACALGRDLAVLYLHWLLPPGVASDRLPPITEKWAHFAEGAPEAAAPEDRGRRPADRLGAFEAFLATFEPRGSRRKPPLHFLHLLLPHGPYRYLPSGRTYNPPRQPLRAWRHGLGQLWERDPLGTFQAEKLYLMQVALVDALVGRLLDRLRESALLDASLVVVTSDHGQTFQAGHSPRVADADTRSEILPVPLFVKAPGQREGRIDDTPLESVDIVPTLAGILGVEPQWPLDGRAAAADAAPRGARRVQRNAERLSFPVERAPWRAALERKLAIFGSGSPSEEILRLGPMQELVGARVEDLDSGGTVPYAVELHDAELFESVDPEARSIPAFVHGWMRTQAGGQEQPRLLAVAIEGRVAAVTSAFPGPKGTLRFQALVAEAAFTAGRNRVELYAVSERAGRPRLRRIPPVAEPGAAGGRR